MNCDNCIHTKVCRHKHNISSALNGIIVSNFGGLSQGWINSQKFVYDNCRYYTQDETQSKEDNHAGL